MSVVAKLRTALDKLGRSNGTDVPEIKAKSNRDKELHARTHEYFVAKQIEKYGKSRAEDALAQLREFVGDDINSVTASTKQAFAWSPSYSVVVKVNAPSVRLDKELLRTKLMLRFKLDGEAVDAFIESCSKEAKPATSIEVTPVS